MQEHEQPERAIDAVGAPHVVLLRPAALTLRSNFVGASATPSLALALLGAVAREAGHTVTAIDATGEALDQYTAFEDTPYFVHGLTTEQVIARIPEDACLIGITCMFSNEWVYHRVLIDAIAEAFPGTPVLVGGEHATAAGDYVLDCCPGVTACALGEGENTLLDVLDALAAGRPLDTVPGLLLRRPGHPPAPTAKRDRIRQLDRLPWPAWDLLPLERYLDAGLAHGVAGRRAMPMLASRGCPYRCTFCSNPGMWGKLWNVRDPADVVAEMKHYVGRYGANSFSFYDLTAVIRREWILRFTALLEAERLNVTWLLPSGTRSEALDAEVVAAMKRSGCLTLNLAPESGSEVTLRRIKKQVNLENMLATVRACAREGIFVRANIIFGFPGETRPDMAGTLRYMVRLAWAGIHDVGVFPFTPYPGSALHEELRAQGAFPADPRAYDLLMAENLNNNYASPRSWSEHLSDRQLRALLVTATLLFYVCQYLFRPHRLLASLARLVTAKPLTLSERVVINTARRFRRMRPGLAAPSTAAAD